VLKGRIDGMESAGTIEGWAFDAEAPLEPLTIAIVDDKARELGWGLAHLYREDLAAAGFAAGWCGFSVKSATAVSRLTERALTLLDRKTGTKIIRRYPVPCAPGPDAALTTIPELVASDPTMAASIFQLKGCDEMFARYVQLHGADAWVEAAYAYLLGRPVDASGLKFYGKQIREKILSPFQLLATVTESEEFKSRPRLLAAPNSAAFPFR